MRRLPRVNATYANSRGPLNRPCPKCGAPPGWKCIRYAYDDNGVAYETGRLTTCHKERRQP